MGRKNIVVLVMGFPDSNVHDHTNNQNLPDFTIFI